MKENYSPVFFLAALGPGGMTVAFFMYYMFMTPHKGYPLPTFDTLMAYFNKAGIYQKVAMVIVLIGIIYFAYKHISLLIKNIIAYNHFKKTEAFQKMKGTLAEITLMAIPLTYAMTINVLFILGALFVPGLWNIVEYLFPLALLGFFAVGIYAGKIFFEYFIPFFIHGNPAWEDNRSFVQLLSSFAFVMIGVGFAAAGAMSHIKAVSAIGIFFAMMFIGAAMVLLLLKFILGFHTIAKKGLTPNAGPSLWIFIPILTLIGITVFRIKFGLTHNFAEGDASVKEFTYVLTASIVALESLVGIFGYLVMKRLNYFEEFVDGDKKDVSSYALVCPGVAYVVFGFFFVHWGLVHNGIIAKYGIAYWVFIAFLAYIQIKTIIVMLKLNKKFGL
ncbi:MAG: hypothetical protein GXN91_03645 [Epsilonproteobacteria bacterium]|nr:hypothetical protein [Campylobacterota bacterium]